MIRKPMGGNRTFFIQNLDQLQHFAKIFAQVLCPGDFIALTGGLGAGKTTFARFLCHALGVTGPITSPTFTLFNRYETAQWHILHGDLYRLEPEDFEDPLAELAEFLVQPDSVVLMEWADKAQALKSQWTWHVHFEATPDSESSRKLIITSMDPARVAILMEQWSAHA